MAATAFDPNVRISWRRAALVSLAVVVLAGTVVALVRGTPRGGDEDAAAAGAAVPTTVVQRSAADEGGSSSGGAVPAPAGASIVRTATLRLRVPGSFAEAVERATDVAVAAGGLVATSSTSSFERGRGSGELTLRVPADRFDQVRRSLGALGTLESSQIGGQDVGGQLVDLDARLRSLRAEEGALDALLARAGDIGQVLQVRDRLTGVRTQIEQLAGQQAALRDQVALATITLAMHQSGSAVATTQGDGSADPAVVESFRTAVGALLAVVGGMVIVVGALLPFAVLALLAWPFVRRYQRRQVSA